MKGLGDIGNLMKQAKKLQLELERAQAEIAELRIEAAAGGGMVSATVNGQGGLTDLKIEQEVVDPDDVDMLVDLIIAAVQEAQSKASDEAKQRLGPLSQGMGLPGMPLG